METISPMPQTLEDILSRFFERCARRFPATLGFDPEQRARWARHLARAEDTRILSDVMTDLTISARFPGDISLATVRGEYLKCGGSFRRKDARTRDDRLNDEKHKALCRLEGRAKARMLDIYRNWPEEKRQNISRRARARLKNHKNSCLREVWTQSLLPETRATLAHGVWSRQLAWEVAAELQDGEFLKLFPKNWANMTGDEV